MIVASGVEIAARQRNGVTQDSRPKLRLFCLPHAGGGSWVFNRWHNRLPPVVEICPILLPGRGNNRRRPPFTGMSLLVKDLARALLPYLDKPLVFFGHSMGALVSFEAARELRRQYGVDSAALFISGCPAPQFFESSLRGRELRLSESVEELCRLFDVGPKLLTNPEFNRLMLPALRADLAVCDTYRYASEQPLNCPISAFGGLQDTEVTCNDLEGWRSQTNGPFRLHMFRGGHFFPQTAECAVLETLSGELDLLAARL